MKIKDKIFYLLFYFLISNLAAGLTIHKDTIDNGLSIFYSEAHKIPMVEIKVIVKAGSVCDPKGKEGLANLVAEMLLRGTVDHLGDELLEKIEFLGASINANTYEDYAEISARALSKDIGLLFAIISECIQKPAFASLEFKRLQRQTYSQISSQMDDPFYAGQVAFRSLLFGDNPLNHDPLGFDSTVSRIDLSDLREFYNTYYAPNNTFIVVVGDFNVDSTQMLIKEYFSNWQRKIIPEISITPPELKGKKGLLIKRDISQSYIFFGFLGPDYKATDWIPARVMNYILGGSGLTSRLATEIREKRGLAYSVFSFFGRFRYSGFFITDVQTKNESANEVIGLIIKEISRIPNDVTQEELNRAKKYYIGNFPLNFDTYREMANFITRIEIEDLGLDYATKFEEMIDGVTLNDIKTSAKKYLQIDNYCLVIVGNIDKNEIKIEGIDWVR